MYELIAVVAVAAAIAVVGWIFYLAVAETYQFIHVAGGF